MGSILVKVQATVRFHGLSLPDVYGLHTSPVPISDGDGLDPCCSPVDVMLCLLNMHCYPFLGIPSLHSIFVFSRSFLHRPSGLSNVRELAITARHLIYNISLLHLSLLFHLHQCLLGSKDGLHT